MSKLFTYIKIINLKIIYIIFLEKKNFSNDELKKVLKSNIINESNYERISEKFIEWDIPDWNKLNNCSYTEYTPNFRIKDYLW